MKTPYERTQNTICNWSRSSGDWIDFDCFEFPLASCLMLPRCSDSFSTFGLIAFRPRCESVIDFNTSVSSQSGERGRSDLQHELSVGTERLNVEKQCQGALWACAACCRTTKVYKALRPELGLLLVTTRRTSSSCPASLKRAGLLWCNTHHRRTPNQSENK